MYLLFCFLLNINIVFSANVSVIGSGYSGLISALELNKLGHNVSIYEKNNFSGGRAFELNLNNQSKFSSGPSWYWMPQKYEDIFNNYLNENISFYELEKLNNSYKLFYNNTNLIIPNNISDIYKLFDSIDNNNKIREFIKIAENNYKFSEKFMYNNYNIFDILNTNNIKNYNNYFEYLDIHLNKFTNNDLLKSLLKWPVIFIGNNPKTSPSIYSLLSYIGYNNGTYYPKKGMNEPIKKLLELIEFYKIPIYFNSEIDKFNYKNNLIESLCFKNNTCEKTQGIVSSIDYFFIEQEILDKKYRHYTKDYWNIINLAPQCLTYYLIVNNTNNLDKLDHHNFFGDINKIDNIFSNNITNELLLYVNKLKYDNYTNLFILVPAHYDIKINETIDDFVFKESINKIQQYIGSINISFKENMNAANYSKLFNSYKGNAFGISNSFNQTLFFKPKMKSKIKNLVFVGQTTHPGPGVVPSMISGYLGANILNDYLNNYSIINFNIYTLIFFTIIFQLIIGIIIFNNKLYLSYSYCIYLFYKNGKTYFAASLLFPYKKLLETASLYSIFRIADDYVDNNDHFEIKEKNLTLFINNFYQCLKLKKGNFKMHPIFPASIENVIKYDFDINLFQRFFNSMKMDLSVTNYDSLDDLYVYMDGSAAVIGEFMIEVLDISKKYKELSRPFAKELGNAFQFTNMIRDIKEDYNLNRNYIPQYYFNKFKIKLDSNGNYDYKAMNFILFMEDLFYEAKKMYNISYYGIQFIPKKYNDVVKCAFINYKSIHDEIRDKKYNIFDKKVSVSFSKKLILMYNNIAFYKIIKIFLKYSIFTYINLFIKNINIVVLIYNICLVNILNLTSLTYMGFHLIFIIPFIIKFFIINKIYHNFDYNINKKKFITKFLQSSFVITIISIFYTKPWDEYLISNKIWSYDKNNILFTYNKIPFEEYLFFVLQNIICGLVLLYYINNYGLNKNNYNINKNNYSIKNNYIKLNSLFLLCLVSIFYIKSISLYMYYILIWSLPILVIQLNYGLYVIINNYKIIIKSIIYSSLFLCIIDKYAIQNFIWNINSDFIYKNYTDYIDILPLEEIIFFIVSSSMCVLGNVLYLTTFKY